MAKTIHVSSQMLLLHTQDLLDQRIIESGSFIPNLTLEFVYKVIGQIVKMMNYTLNKDTLKIEYIAKKDKKRFYLDRRRV